MGMIGNTLAQGLISGANIQDGTVDTPDIKDGAVTPAKHSTGTPTWDSSGNVSFGGAPIATRLNVRNARSDTAGSGWLTWENSSETAGKRGLRVDTSNAFWFDWYNGSSWSAQVGINSSGQFGIGGAPSNAALHVKADWISGHSTVKAQTSSAIASGGTVGYGTYDSDGTRLGYFYSNSTQTSIGSSASYPLVFETAGQDRGRFSTDGKFTVGTGAPTSGKLNIAAGGAAGVGWSTGLNIGDASNYMGFIQDTGISRFRNFGTGGFQFFNASGTALLSIADGGGLTNYQGNTILHTGNVSQLNTSIVDPNLAVPSGFNSFQPFLINGNSPGPTGGDGCVIAWKWVSSGYMSQIYVDIDPTNYFAVRTANSSGGWSSWRNF